VRTIALACLFVGALYAQTLPTSMTECESGLCNSGGNGPGTWTFSGREGTAVLPVLGVTANLTIERFDSGAVVIHRKDTSQKSLGLTVAYTGKLNGNRVEGDVSYSWPGNANVPPNAKWYAIFNTGSVYSGKHDVNGIWHALLPEPNKGIVWRTKIEQNADTVKIIWAENHTAVDGNTAFEGRFVSDTAIEGIVFWPGSTPQKPNTSFGRFAIDGDRLLTNTGGIFERGIGPPSVQRQHGPTTEQALLFGVYMVGRLMGRRTGLPGRIQEAMSDAGAYDVACHSDSRKISNCSAARVLGFEKYLSLSQV
jgi:hypothetical protein